jgi:RNA polymerase sigma-70 factor (sigma-E family)
VRERSPAAEPETEPATEPDAGAEAAASPPRALAEPTPTFAELYRDSHAEMVRLAYLLTGSTEVAQDVVQDAFVSVHRSWSRVREPRPYLRRAVVNACTSHHRRVFRDRRSRTRMASGDTPAELEADEMFDVLAELPARQRAAVVLRYWHDLDEREIADTLGCRPGTVGSLLHRAIARLREVVEP